MKGARRLLPLLVVVSLVVVGLIAVFLREPVRKTVVLPISYAIWYINQILESVPQPVFWWLMIMASLYLIGRMFLKSMPVRDLNPGPAARPHSASRYQFWLWYVRTFPYSQFSQELLARSLNRLIVDILAYQENLDIDDVYIQIGQGGLDLPPNIREFLRNRQFELPTYRARWLERLRDFFRTGKLFQRDKQSATLGPAKTELEDIIRFIESRLEVQGE